MSPLELIRDAEALAEMSLGETLIAGVQIALVGMIVVFSILVLLMISIKIMERLVNSDGTSPADKSTKKAKPESEKKSKSRGSKTRADKLDPEILAVITASIQSYYGSGKKFKILRVKDHDEKISAWGQQARGSSKK